MELVLKKLDELKPYPNNPRVNEQAVDSVAESIRQCEYVAPIVVDENNVILAGHTRLKALQKLGESECEVVVKSGLTDEQKRKYRLLDNKTGELAEWDFNKLAAEIEGLDFGDLDLDWELDLDDDLETTEDNYDEEPNDEPIAQRGDIYQLGNHRLMCGDSTDPDDVEKLLEGANIDLVFTDPPYGIDIVSDNGEVGADFGIAKKGIYDKVTADETTETAEKFYNTCILVGFDRFIIWGGNYFTPFLPFSDGWLIWDKRCDSGIRNTFADGEMAWCSFHTPIRIYRQLWNGMIREGEHEKRVHPTQKPVMVLGNILQDFTNGGENIYDGFGGSGTTLIACEQLDRTCYMMELEPKYVDLIIDRWEKFTGEKAVKLNGETS